MLLTCLAPAAVAGERDLATTRWQIASQLYLLSWGRFDRAEWVARLDNMVRLGFNAVRVNVWWGEIVPDRAALERGGNWEPLDQVIALATERDLEIILTVCLRRPNDGLFFGPEDRVQNADGQPDSNWDQTTRCSFASPRFGSALRFWREVAARYVPSQNAGRILAIGPLVTREAEIAYAHETPEDYNPAFVAEFRVWLQRRYEGRIERLNDAWAGQWASFEAVAPPREFATPAGRDWYCFRDLKTRQFVDTCAAAVADLPGLTRPYRLLLDYGNVADPMARLRGSLSFTFHAANPAVLFIKQNDAHDYDQRFSAGVLVGNARRMGKLALNEFFYDRDAARYPTGRIVEDSVREISAHFAQGCNGVSYVGVEPGDATFEAIVGRLKADGVWSAPVAARQPATTLRATLADLLGLDGWQIRERYFEPQWQAGQTVTDLLVDVDDPGDLLPQLPF